LSIIIIIIITNSCAAWSNRLAAFSGFTTAYGIHTAYISAYVRNIAACGVRCTPYAPIPLKVRDGVPRPIDDNLKKELKLKL